MVEDIDPKDLFEVVETAGWWGGDSSGRVVATVGQGGATCHPTWTVLVRLCCAKCGEDSL